MPPGDQQDLVNRFGYHRATEETGPKHDEIRDACLQLAMTIHDLCPNSREKSLAFTALEEAMHWANAAIAVNQAPLTTTRS